MLKILASDLELVPDAERESQNRGRAMMHYPSAIAELLGAMPLAPLGFGEPVHAWKAKIASITDASFGTVVDRDAAAACRAGLWLAFDFFEESHAISQDLETREGSYWHGILHRREPDAFNAKYWFRRVGKHPIFVKMGEGWSPEGFVDHCENHRGTGSEAETTARLVQLSEWELLFEWCFSRAVG